MSSIPSYDMSKSSTVSLSQSKPSIMPLTQSKSSTMSKLSQSKSLTVSTKNQSKKDCDCEMDNVTESKTINDFIDSYLAKKYMKM